MKFKLQKSGRRKQDSIQDAVRSGLPLAGLLAVAALAGCATDSAEEPLEVEVIDVLCDESVAGFVWHYQPELPQETGVYVVREGDTLSRIAREYRVPLETLRTMNRFSSEEANRLKVGQEIIVPLRSNQKNEVVPPAIAGVPAPQVEVNNEAE